MALSGLVTLTFDLVQDVSRGTDNLPADIGVSANMHQTDETLTSDL